MPCNGHICNALNIGLESAQGEFIARIDSDDVWEKNKLEKQIRVMENNSKIGACFSWVNIIDDESILNNTEEESCYKLFRQDNKDRVSHIRDLFYNGCYLCHPTVVLRKKTVEQVGNYDYSLVQIQDYDYWLRLLLLADIYIINEELVRYRRCKDANKNISANTDKANVRSLNENMLMKNKFINNLTNAQFVEIFQEDFQYKNAQTNEELECEKAFVLLNCFKKSKRYPVGGMYKLNKLLNQDKTRKVLNNQYDFTDIDFYNLMSNHIFYDYILEQMIQELHERRKDVEYLKKDVEYLENENIKLKEYCDAYEFSKSWRMTKPFRDVSRKIARIKRPIQNAKYHLYYGKNKRTMPNIYLMNSEDYGNLGDLQIAASEMEWLEHYFG